MGRRRISALIGLLCLAAASAAGLAGGLVAGAPGNAARPDAGQHVNADQAGRLAGARLANFQDARASFHAVITAPGGDVHVTGWIDWSLPLIYLNSAAVGQASPADGLVQAVPGLVAVRAGRYPAAGTDSGPAADTYPAPPATPPADGWRVRQMDPAPGTSVFDGLLAVLFSLATPTADDPAAILAAGRTAIRAGDLAGVPVEIYTGPALTTPLASPTASAPASSSSSSPGTRPEADPGSTMPAVTGTVQYWLDGAGRMRRVVTDLGANLPVQVDLASGGPQLTAVLMLGGAPVTPRALTDDELRLLSRMRQHNRQSGGGTVSLTLPVNPAGLTVATGWLDWRSAVGYLALRNLDDPAANQLLRLDTRGLASREGGADGSPPLHPPTDSWHYSAWGGRGDAYGATDLDILLIQAVTMTYTRTDSLAELRTSASFLRMDTLAGESILVVEIRQAVEAGVAPGAGRLRYWVDRDGLLRRIEVRTRQGGFGWLDVTPANVPALPDPHTS
jgi:hypothetical protein